MEKKSRAEIVKLLEDYKINSICEKTGLAPITIRQLKDQAHKPRKSTMFAIATILRVEWSGE